MRRPVYRSKRATVQKRYRRKPRGGVRLTRYSRYEAVISTFSLTSFWIRF